jgi:hypothetical protein
MESSREGSIHKMLSLDESSSSVGVKRDQPLDSFDVVQGIIASGPQRNYRHSADFSIPSPNSTRRSARPQPHPTAYSEPLSPAPPVVATREATLTPPKKAPLVGGFVGSDGGSGGGGNGGENNDKDVDQPTVVRKKVSTATDVNLEILEEVSDL